MKAFEEWWLMEGQNIVGHYDQEEEYLAHDVWRAVLEWVLTQRTSVIEEDGSLSYCNYVSINVIKEELKCL